MPRVWGQSKVRGETEDFIFFSLLHPEDAVQVKSDFWRIPMHSARELLLCKRCSYRVPCLEYSDWCLVCRSVEFADTLEFLKDKDTILTFILMMAD